jgi:hypothetical protein
MGASAQKIRFTIESGAEIGQIWRLLTKTSPFEGHSMLGSTAASQAAPRLTKTSTRTETDEWRATPTPDIFTGAANLLSAIGDPVRLQILWWLGKNERNVTDLCSLVGKRQQAVSHHLTILKLRRLVALHRRGKSNFYSLTEQGREAMVAAGPFIH